MSVHANQSHSAPDRRHVATAIAGVLGLLFALAMVAACGGESTSTASPSAAAIRQGGVLKVGIQTGNGELDPALFAGNPADIMLQAQVLEKLVELGRDFSVQPVLATEWASGDGATWTFTLREGVQFSNGEAFSADDVVHTMERLRSWELGSPMASVYTNITTVTADDPLHVTFALATPDAEFPASLTDYRTLMLCRSVKDPAEEIVGTGPFVLDSSKAAGRVILKKNATYWGKDDAGTQLPYLDEIDLISMPEAAGRAGALLRGSLDFVAPLTSETKQAVEADENMKTITTGTNDCYELQIRTDQGPGKELKFRQAIMAGTDRQAIVDLVAPGVAVPGNGTLVGPAYADYYLEDPGTYDPDKAKRLLAEAGFVDGAEIELVTLTADVVPAIATAWQAQMKAIGIDVKIRRVSPDVFYADSGDDNWYNADFCIVDYGTRAAPITYFGLALTSDAAWNYSRWSNVDFDALAKQIPLELDTGRRADLYKQAEAILRDQVPMMNFLVSTGVGGHSGGVGGIVLAPDWAQTLYRTAHFTE